MTVARDGSTSPGIFLACRHGARSRSIAPSTFNPATAYITVDLHLMDNRNPFIYKTTDFGKTWTQISGNLPKHSLSYVRTIAEDPNCEGLLFAGTGMSFFTLSTTGATGQRSTRDCPMRR